jgi:D-3-phosphoglycerate dehydrogenase
MGAYPEWDMERLESTYVVHRLWEAADQASFLAEVGPGVQAIATRGEIGASRDLMQQLPRLEIISCYGVGTDTIDLEAARMRGIHVTNTPGVLNKDVADMALSLILAVLRSIPCGDRHVRSGEWLTRSMGLTTSLTGKTVGILGLGRIGREVAKRAEAFDTTVVYSDVVQYAGYSYSYYATTEELAHVADVLVVTVSGGEGTKHIVNGDVLKALGPKGVLINVSRGSTVDEEALIAALQQGTIRAAGLDVFANEPNIDARFLQLDNVVLQPHHSSGTIETRKAMGKLVLDNLQAYFRGEPLLTPVI